MAQTESRIRLIFDGVSKGVVAAAAETRAAVAGVGNESERLNKRLGGVGFDKLAASMRGLGDDAERLNKRLPNLSLGLSNLRAHTKLIGAAIIAAAPLLGQAFAGAVPVLTAVGVAAGTVKLGMDGIKKAAEAARKPFDDLKAAVSGTFERSLTQPFRAVAALLPKLTDGFTGVAASISGLIAQVIKVGTSAEGVAKLQAILAGTRVFIDGMAPGLARLVDGFLTLSANATPSMRELGAAVGDVFGKLGDVLKNLPFDTVNTAIRAFAATLSGIGSVIASVVDLLVRMGAALGDSVGVVLDNLAAGIDRASPGLVDLASAFGDLLRAVAPALPVIGEIAGAIAHELADAIRAAIPYVQTFVKFLSDNKDVLIALVPYVVSAVAALKTLRILTSIVGWAAGAFSGLLRLAGVISRIGGVAGGAGTKVGVFGRALSLLKIIGLAGGLAAAAKAMDDVNIAAAGGSDKLTGFAENLHDIVGAGELIASGNFGEIFRQIGEQVSQVGQAWSNGETPVQHWFDTVKTSFQNDFIGVLAAVPGQIAGFLSGLGSTIATNASTAWDSFVTTTSTKLDEAVTFVTGLPGRVGAGLSTLGGTVAQAAQTAWDALVTATQTAIDTVVTFTTDLPFKVGFALGALAGIILTGAVNAWNGLTTATTTAIDSTVSFATSLPSRIGQAISALASTLASNAQTAWNSFSSVTMSVANSVVDFVRSIPGAIGQALSSLASTLASNAQTAWNSFSSVTMSVANSVIGFVRSVPGLISSALSALGGLLSNIASSAWSAFRNAVVSGTNAVIGFVRSIPGMVTSALGNLGGLLVGAGRALLQGFLNGIQSMAATIRSFVAGFVAGIRAYFPFSPAQKGAFSGRGWTLYSGQALIEGMAEGIASRTGLIASAADAAMRAAQMSLSSPLTMTDSALSVTAPNQAAAAVQQLINAQQSSTPIEVTVLLDGQPVRDIARTEINTTSRATRRTVLAGAGTSF